MNHQITKTSELLGTRKRILVTGGAGFIGGAVVRRLLQETEATVFNLDKMGYASDLSSIKKTLVELGEEHLPRHQLLKVNLKSLTDVQAAVQTSDPDLVLNLAAESHVDRSISSPGQFLDSNVIGTYNLLQSVLIHYRNLNTERQENFRLHHISTDEVFGSLGANGQFSENTPYAPRSPYAASKAASDHLVQAWHHTYGLPVITTNCSNNYGPWQFPEKLIPVVILKAARQEAIPLYGDGKNIRDWLHVEDHVDALLLAACQGQSGRSYCVGGHGERTNIEVVETICKLLDELKPSAKTHQRLITFVADRLGHDRRYAINPQRIETELGFHPRYRFSAGLRATVIWYLENQNWCEQVSANRK